MRINVLRQEISFLQLAQRFSEMQNLKKIIASRNGQLTKYELKWSIFNI